MHADYAIYPASAFDPKTIDEHFLAEAAQLLEPPSLFSLEEERLIAKGRQLAGATLLYRGWILTPDQYSALQKLVEAQGARILINAEQYQRSQFGRDWFSLVGDLTPATRVLNYGAAIADFAAAFDGLQTPQAVIKGVSKSLKHDWDNAMFIRDGTDLPRVLDNFRGNVSADEEPQILLRAYESWD